MDDRPRSEDSDDVTAALVLLSPEVSFFSQFILSSHHLEMLSVTFKNRHIEKFTWRCHLALKPHFRKIPAMANIAGFNKKLVMTSRHIVEKFLEPPAAI